MLVYNMLYNYICYIFYFNCFFIKKKYIYLLNLLIIINIKLYIAYIISFFYFNNLIIKLNKTIF